VKFRVFRPQKEPGVRLSVADVGIVSVAFGASVLLFNDPYLCALWPLPIHLICTFLCFCNLFRIGTPAELTWASVFLLSWIGAAAMALPPYPAVLVTTVPALVAVVVWSMFHGHYNGLFHDRVAAMRNVRDFEDLDLHRFIEAQNENYLQAKKEIAAGRKVGHWMWFIFPNWKGLGKSVFAQKYAIGSVDEARAYLNHPLLGARLKKCTELLLAHDGKTANEIFGTPDDLKLLSCMTLFAELSPSGSVFHTALDRYFSGRKDERTVAAMITGRAA
jgi:Uncharacterized conserved protein